jgi:hypothetical protein
MKKVILVETISGMRGRGIKENGGEVNSNIYFIYYKNFCKCHNVSPTSHNNKKKNQGCSSVLEHLPSLYKPLSSIPSSGKKITHKFLFMYLFRWDRFELRCSTA